MFWRTVDGNGEAPESSPQLKVMLQGMMDKKRILDIISNYTFFVHEEDKSFKILAGYHQYFAVKKHYIRHILLLQKMEIEK